MDATTAGASDPQTRAPLRPAVIRRADEPPLITDAKLVMKCQGSSTAALAYSPDGRYVASSHGNPDSAIILWDAATGEEVRRLKPPEGTRIWSPFGFSGDGSRILCSEFFTARLWDVQTGRPIGTPGGRGSAFDTIVFAHRGPFALMTRADATVRLWDVEKSAEIRQFSGHTHRILAAAFSPDDRLVAGGNFHGIVYLWNVSTGKVIREWPAGVTDVSAIAIAPDGRSLLTAGRFNRRGEAPDPPVENPLCVWDLEGNEIRRFPAHAEGICAAEFSPDGRFIISIDHLRSVKNRPSYGGGCLTLWEVATGRVVCRFSGHAPLAASAVCFSPDGRHVTSAGTDKTIKVWGIPDSIRIEPAEPPAPTEQRGLPDISKVLTYQVPALIEAGQLAEAQDRIEEARRDLHFFATVTGIPLWDRSVGGLLRLADTKESLLIKKGYSQTGGIGGSDEEGERVLPPSTERLSPEQNKELATIRAGLSQATQSIRQGKFADGQSEILRAREQLRAFVDASRIPEWHLAVASVYQLAARRQTELDNRRGVEESRTAALAAEAAQEKADTAARASGSQALSVGQPAPLFTAATVDGRPFSLQQFRKKWVLIDFWATWCGPCRAEMPNLKDVYATFGKDERFAMISLSIDNQVDDPLQYAQQNGLGWIQGFLGNGWNSPVLKMYHVHGIPAMFLIDPDGKIAATGLRGERIKTAIAEALGAN